MTCLSQEAILVSRIPSIHSPACGPCGEMDTKRRGRGVYFRKKKKSWSSASGYACGVVKSFLILPLVTLGVWLLTWQCAYVRLFMYACWWATIQQCWRAQHLASAFSLQDDLKDINEIKKRGHWALTVRLTIAVGDYYVIQIKALHQCCIILT